MFQDVYTAIITPFQNGKVDEKKLEELVSCQIEAGVKGVVPCGSTGEYLFLTPEEKIRIIEICANLCKGKAQVIAGTGAVSTEETIFQTQRAQKAGATAALIITPWYVRPSQEGLYLHYKKISQNVELPIIIYNNPARTAVDMSLETLLRLMECPAIQGYKDSSSNFVMISELKQQLGDRLSLLAGNDEPLAAFLAMGGDGGILPVANVAPTHFVELMDSWRMGDLSAFKAQWKKVFPLLIALTLERNPAPLKYAMTLVYGVSPENRLPYAPLQESTKKAIEDALENLGLWMPPASERLR
ncbi:MAG: 4-hydroxy-tetrahydrodipicolinate synthase [Alphaproteobacteria bacterium]|nr:4-hydroxy-tetrahydrodipicolinate synthase [Alphaproteobacteria bacterium]